MRSVKNVRHMLNAKFLRLHGQDVVAPNAIVPTSRQRERTADRENKRPRNLRTLIIKY